MVLGTHRASAGVLVQVRGTGVVVGMGGGGRTGALVAVGAIGAEVGRKGQLVLGHSFSEAVQLGGLAWVTHQPPEQTLQGSLMAAFERSSVVLTVKR